MAGRSRQRFESLVNASFLLPATALSHSNTETNMHRTRTLSRRNLLKNASLATIGALIPATATVAHSQEAKPKACAAERDWIFFDNLDLIVQQDCDGGDTAQREGMYWLGQWVRTSNHLNGTWYGSPRKVSFAQVMDHLEHQKTGRFRRHPTQSPWSDPDRTSRDQVVPLVAAMGVHNDFERLRRFHDRLSADGFLINKDTLIAYQEYIKRARDQEVHRTIDTFAMDRAVDLRHAQASDDKDDVGDDLNLIVQLLLAAVRKGNNQTDAVRARYALRRPKNYGIYLTAYREVYGTEWNARNKDVMVKRMDDGINNRGWKPDCTNVAGVLRWYFRAEEGGGPGFAPLYQPIFDKYFAAPIDS
jgi:hypothetical protein